MYFKLLVCRLALRMEKRERAPRIPFGRLRHEDKRKKRITAVTVGRVSCLPGHPACRKKKKTEVCGFSAPLALSRKEKPEKKGTKDGAALLYWWFPLSALKQW